MRAFLQCVQRFASILICACALPAYAVADAPKIVHIGYQKSGFLQLNAQSYGFRTTCTTDRLPAYERFPVNSSAVDVIGFPVRLVQAHCG